MEHRRLETRTDLSLIPDWPGLAQVARVTRSRTCGAETTEEVVYYITSLMRRQTSAQMLLKLVRGHWAIENRLHYVRDVTLGEDASRVRKGHALENLALFRNLAIGLCRRSPVARERRRVYIPSILRAHQADPSLALALVLPEGSPLATCPVQSANTSRGRRDS